MDKNLIEEKDFICSDSYSYFSYLYNNYNNYKNYNNKISNLQ